MGLVWTLALALSQGFPQLAEQHLNDFAGVVSAADAQVIRSTCQRLLDETGIAVVVVTIRRLADIEGGRYASFTEFCTVLFNRWGIGHPPENRGILLALSTEDRDLHIEPGAGYGTARDAEFGRVSDNMTPHLRDNEFSRGLVVGVQGLDAMVRGGGGGASGTRPPSCSGGIAPILGCPLLCGGGLIVGVLSLIGMVGRRRRLGWGGGYGVPMGPRFGGWGGGGFRSGGFGGGHRSSFGGGFSRGGGISRKF